MQILTVGTIQLLLGLLTVLYLSVFFFGQTFSYSYQERHVVRLYCNV